jgi:hypothetical protein
MYIENNNKAGITRNSKFIHAPAERVYHAFADSAKDMIQ